VIKLSSAAIAISFLFAIAPAFAIDKAIERTFRRLENYRSKVRPKDFVSSVKRNKDGDWSGWRQAQTSKISPFIPPFLVFRNFQ